MSSGFNIYEYDNTMTGQTEWVVEKDGRDVKTFTWPFAKLRAQCYVRTHHG